MPSSILNSDDGVISGTAGLKNSGGDDAVLLIQTKGVTAQTVDAGQRTMFPTTIGVGGATPSTSGAGVTFPATQSASTNANTLDDYEEGTWEPDIRPESGSFTSVTVHPDNGGKYIKIGQMVYLTATVGWTALNTTGGSGVALIGDLPFACASRSNGDNADGPGPTRTSQWNGTGSNVPTLVSMFAGSSVLRMFTQDGDAVADVVNVSELGTACLITFTIVMYTT